MKKVLLSTCAIAATMMISTGAFANATIGEPAGGYSAGIGPDGELYDNATGIGLMNPAGSDYIKPGTPRDSWGVTSSNGSAYADYAYYGTVGITGTTTTATGNSATTVSTTAAGITVAQAFNFFAPNILSVQETLTNVNLFDLTGVIFRRNVDLDINPTAFNENIFGPLGSNSAVVGNSYFGFENPNPASAFSSQCGTSCNQVGDLGAGIDLGIGNLAAGQSVTFAYYYGINTPGQNLNQLFTQAQGLGLNYLIGGQSSENGLYPNLGAGSGFLGVSGIGTVAAPAPEPQTWLMMIVGFGLVGGALRRRQQNATLSYAL